MIFLGIELYERSMDSDIFKEQAEPDGSGSPAKVWSYPDEITLVRHDGSELDVRLTARNGTHIQFERIVDDQSFVFEIDQLDESTQAVIRKYPDSGLRDTGALLRDGQVTLETAYLEQLREAISKIDQRINEIQTEISVSASKQEQRTLKNEANALTLERQELKQKIAARTGS